MCEIDWSALGGMISAVAALIAVIFGYGQLKKLNVSLNDSNLMKVFEIEFELNRRKERCSEILMSNKAFIYDLKCNFQNADENREMSENQKNQIKRMKAYYDEAHDNYLNAFERMADLILRNKMKEDDFRSYYFKTLKTLITDSNRDSFGDNSPFTNMKKLYDKWNV